ncbi:hypothetical protein SAMN05421595_2672 [Austwickia chelonae]|uniref:Lipoprotein n=1 Tax=Austwickia chelonae NBRC 105200 TaxID=1184607 RepID=K6UMU0_9MICO|nr:hypothetical protein [Austwickia chelonae]GAB78406.1 hypothetical protein AUCHE_09_00120 [Austwickia chelonae NBRC 105200]SEW39275.1 hypothetical protein SAMN05421595_2672 [Austwickia chelonae]
MGSSQARLWCVLVVAGVVAGSAGCGGAGVPAGGAPGPLPTASGVLEPSDSRAAFERAAHAFREQRTVAVNFSVDRVDGQPVRQVLNPTVRLDLRDERKPVASLALSILASNVAVGDRVYRQQADADGSSTVWVSDPEPRSPVEFVLWKPDSPKVRVSALGQEMVADRPARRFRVYDPALYSGPTVGPLPSTTGPGAASGPSSPTSEAGVGDYDEFWLGDDGHLLRMVSVMGQLRLTSTRIEYGGDLRVDVPDTTKAITAEEYRRRRPPGEGVAGR